jgi:uncharacterized protein DUF6688
MAANLGISIRINQFRSAKSQFQIWQLFAWITWLAAYFAAWRFAVETALQEYAALPTEPPSGTCTVWAASAAGHRAIAGWWELRDSEGQPFRVSMQLAYLKCGEIALWTISPSVHRVVRGIYDRLGPALVPIFGNAWAADAACILLKPAEWMVRLVLTPVIRNFSVIAATLYG